MKKFPALDEYSDDELIVIVHDEKDDWQNDAIIYAKKLLADRGLSEEYSRERIKEIRTEFEILWQQELEERKIESYSIISLIFMALFWPRHLFRDWYLKRDGYYRKRNQRLTTIAIGVLIYFIPMISSLSTYDEREIERIAEINRNAEIDSISISQIDWSGKYTFIDSSNQSSNKIVWNLKLIKEQGKHSGTLTFKTGNNTKVVSCIGLVKDDVMEFYPDTSYTLTNGAEISYYDRLFTFGRDDLEIYTKWGKLTPVYSGTRSMNEYFLKNKSM
ncbi:MAG: hypothetical protein JKX79_13020 [Labilibaculum sp.]|nr:hypothetical protein [Labilibaculum sp.]